MIVQLIIVIDLAARDKATIGGKLLEPDLGSIRVVGVGPGHQEPAKGECGHFSVGLFPEKLARIRN